MNNSKYVILMLVLLAVFFGSGGSALAQIDCPPLPIPNPADTMRFVSTNGLPGDTVAVQLWVSNHTYTVAGMNYMFRFDTTHVKPFIDPASLTEDEVVFDQIGRAFAPQPAAQGYPFDFASAVRTNEVSQGKQVIAGIHVTRGPQPPDTWDTHIDEGVGSLLQIYFIVDEGAPLGDSVAIELFNEEGGGRTCNYSDTSSCIVDPRLVKGYIRFQEQVIGEENDPPFFTSPSAGQQFNVQQGGSVSFTVSAADPQTNQALVLSLVNGPSGASFPTATGNGSVSQTFSWTTDIGDVGIVNATFRVVDDSSAAVTRTVSINVTEQPPPEDDLLYTSSKEPGGRIEGGIPGANDVSVPVNLNDLNVLYGVQFDIEYSSAQMALDSIVPTDRLTGFETSSEIVGPGIRRVVSYGLNNETIQPGSSGNAIFNCWFRINNTAVPGLYKFKLKNGRASLSPGQGSLELNVDTTGAVAVDNLGDANLDRFVDVGDLVTIVAYIIGDRELETREFRAANVNGDIEVNVVDLVGVIDIIFTGAAPAPFHKLEYFGEPAVVDIGRNASDNEIGILSIDAELPTDIAGAQFDLRYNHSEIDVGEPYLTDLSDGLILRHRKLDDSRLRVLMYFPPDATRNVIASGTGHILEIPVYGPECWYDDPTCVELENIVLSDPDGREIPTKKSTGQLPTDFTLHQNYPNPFNPETRIGFAVGGGRAQHVELTVYNILGQKVRTLVSGEMMPGTYEVTFDGTDSSGEKLASGVYFYTLSADEVRETRKMLLAK